MWTVGIEAELVSSQPMTADDITDLLEQLSDALDGERVELETLRTEGIGTRITLCVEVVVQANERTEALATANGPILRAMGRAGIGTDALDMPTGIRSSAKDLALT